jgi:hypothetical protein
MNATPGMARSISVAGVAYNKGRFDGIYLGQKAQRKLVFAGEVEHGFSEAQVKDSDTWQFIAS